MKNPYPLLRLISLVEGLSYVILLGVAMPLKYLADQPLAVTIVGAIHGVLFLLFVGQWQHARIADDWPARRSAWVFAVAGFVPFGPLFVDRRLREWERDLLRRRDAGGAAD